MRHYDWLQRFLQMVLTLLGITVVAFLLREAIPGDPVEILLGKEGLFQPSPEEVRLFRTRFGLDRPLFVQYFRWLGDVLRGDLGRSFVTKRPVAQEIRERLPATLLLALAGFSFAVLIGLLGGVFLAFWSGSIVDHLVRVVTLLFRSMPTFFVAVVLITLLGERWRVFPTSGMGSWRHLVLPAVVSGSGFGILIMRLLRTNLLQVLGNDYILAARARGLSAWKVLLKHAFPNGFVSVLTMFGLYLGGILGGSPVVETIFAWPGAGRLLVQAIYGRDFPLLQAFVLVFGVTYVAMQMLVDVCYFFLNPQVRPGKRIV